MDGRQATAAPGALRFGTLIHGALAAYYVPGRKRGAKPWETYEQLYYAQADELKDRGFNVLAEDDEWTDALPLGVGMLQGYVQRYAEEDKEFSVISSEQTFQLVVNVGAPQHDGHVWQRALRPFRFKAVGTFDGVWKHLPTGRLVFKEFKTATAISTDGLPMDEQASMYWTYGPKWLRRQGLLGRHDNLSHILYTFLRKAVPDPAARRDKEGHVLNKDGSVSKRQPAAYFSRVPVYRDEADRRIFHERVCQEAIDLELARLGMLPLYKNPGYLLFPNCRGCPVREACELHETGGDWQAVLDQTTVAWDPYEAHELRED